MAQHYVDYVPLGFVLSTVAIPDHRWPSRCWRSAAFTAAVTKSLICLPWGLPRKHLRDVKLTRISLLLVQYKPLALDTILQRLSFMVRQRSFCGYSNNFVEGIPFYERICLLTSTTVYILICFETDTVCLTVSQCVISCVPFNYRINDL